MANGLKNDRGEWVTAIGSPYSLERLRCRRPSMLKDLEDFQELYNRDSFPWDRFGWCTVESYLIREYSDVTEEWEHILIAEHLGIEY